MITPHNSDPISWDEANSEPPRSDEDGGHRIEVRPLPHYADQTLNKPRKPRAAKTAKAQRPAAVDPATPPPPPPSPVNVFAVCAKCAAVFTLSFESKPTFDQIYNAKTRALKQHAAQCGQKDAA